MNKHQQKVVFSSASVDWYTPPVIIQRVEQVFGGPIDLDPCSNSHTEPAVPARKRYTKEDDGLAQDWEGSVYMNPPYNRRMIRWVRKLQVSYEGGYVTQAIALLPARVDVKWFQLILDYPVCFAVGRLKFSGHENGAPFPSAIVYLGDKPLVFRDAFADIGSTWQRI